MYLLELSSAPLRRRPQRQDRCGYSGSVCIHDRKPTAACPAAELTAMGSMSVFSPQLIFLLLVSNSQNAQEALTQPSRCHTFCYSFKSKAGTGTTFGKTAGVPQATPGTALEGCPLQWHSGTGHSPVPVLPKLSVHPWDSWMHFQVLRKGLKL